jgi:hypothetical protein
MVVSGTRESEQPSQTGGGLSASLFCLYDHSVWHGVLGGGGMAHE